MTKDTAKTASMLDAKPAEGAKALPSGTDTKATDEVNLKLIAEDAAADAALNARATELALEMFKGMQDAAASKDADSEENEKLKVPYVLARPYWDGLVRHERGDTVRFLIGKAPKTATRA